jgi:gliding motility-associated-like protein
MDINFIDPYLNLPEHYCFEKNLIIAASPYNAPATGTYQWYRNKVALPSEDNVSLLVNQRGIYTISYTFDQCTVVDSTNITLPEELVSPDKLICEGGTTTLTTSVIPKGVYVWRHNAAIVGGNSNSISITDDGNELYIVTVTDSLQCVAKDSVYARTIAPPQINLNNTPSCIGNTVTLNAVPINIGNATDPTYTWFKDGSQLPNIGSTITVSNTGKYNVIYTVGECKAYDTSIVTFHPLPGSNNRDFVNYCKETEIRAVLDAGEAYGYEWLESGNKTRRDTVYNPGYYKVRIINEFNCQIIDSINVRDICPPRIFVPTVFSPNGDGKNDLFDVSGFYFKNFNLTIFNRWGEIIFNSTDRNLSWDGKYRDEPMPIGVYAWIITYEGEYSEYKGPYRLEGSVTVTR